MQDITGGKIPFPFWEEAPFHIWGIEGTAPIRQ